MPPPPQEPVVNQAFSCLSRVSAEEEVTPGASRTHNLGASAREAHCTVALQFQVLPHLRLPMDLCKFHQLIYYQRRMNGPPIMKMWKTSSEQLFRSSLWMCSVRQSDNSVSLAALNSYFGVQCKVTCHHLQSRVSSSLTWAWHSAFLLTVGAVSPSSPCRWSEAFTCGFS